MRMFDMSGDSGLFHTREELEALGCRLRGTAFSGPTGAFLPLYEGKMIGQFDHRYGTYEGQTQAQANKGVLPHLTDEQHADLELLPLPEYWIAEAGVCKRRKAACLGEYDLAFRDVTGPTYVEEHNLRGHPANGC